jgi:DNA-directed RNA polymerase subunit RPC12/RpoP
MEMAEEAIQFECRGCGKKLRAKKELAGKGVQCHVCGEKLMVPGRSQASGTKALVAAPSPSPIPATPAAVPLAVTVGEVKEKLPAPMPAMPPIEKRYRALRAIAFLIKIVGALTVVGGLVAIPLLLVAGSSQGGRTNVLAVVPLIGGWLLLTIGTFATAESIMVLVDIEENSRRAAEANLLMARAALDRQGT